MPKTDANINIGADTTAFTTQMAGLEKGIVAQMDKIGKVFMGALGLGAAAKSITRAFSAFTEPAAELENVATSLGVVMGNAEAAERLASSLQRMATNGVVGMDDLHASARALSNVFQDDAVIAHYVGRLADLAAGSKIPAARLGELVARMEDMGKAKLTELSNAGIPIFEALASVLGKSTEEVVKMSSAGKISCSALLAAFEELTDAGGRYYRLNSEMSNTTSGSWDTLKASITECMAALGEPINDSIRPVLQDLAVWVQENKDSISALGKGIINVCTSVHTLTIGLGILAATMRGQVVASMAKMVAAFKPAMVGIRNFRMAWTLTGSFWSATWAGMVVTARAASVAIKGALISTGIGILVWAIGEAVAWCAEQFSDAEDAAKDMGAAAEDAAKSTEAALEASRREMEEREAALRKERERTQEMEEQARLAKEAADAEQQRLRTINDVRKARMDAQFEREMDLQRDMPVGLNGGTQAVIRERLRRVGAPSEEALYAEHNRLERLYHPTEEQLERYKELTEAITKIEEEHRKAEEAAAAHQEENRKRRDNYYDRRSTYNENQEEEAYKKKSIGGQERQLRRDAQAAGYWGEMNPDKIREHLDELARTGAQDNEDRIAALERILQLHDELVERKQRYQQQRATDMQELRIQALELAGRKRAADALREELALQQRITELRERGATPRQAKQQAEMEAKVRQAAEQRARIQAARVEFIQGHQANVGGGGVSFRLGNTQLQESKKHSKLLKDIYNAVKNQKNTSAGVAVLA